MKRIEIGYQGEQPIIANMTELQQELNEAVREYSGHTYATDEDLDTARSDADALKALKAPL